MKSLYKIYKELICELFHQINIRISISLIPQIIDGTKSDRNYEDYYSLASKIVLDEHLLYDSMGKFSIRLPKKYIRLYTLEYFIIYYNIDDDIYVIRVNPRLSLSKRWLLLKKAIQDKPLVTREFKKFAEDYINSMQLAYDIIASHVKLSIHKGFRIEDKDYYDNAVYLLPHECEDEINCIAEAFFKVQSVRFYHDKYPLIKKDRTPEDYLSVLSILYPYFKKYDMIPHSCATIIDPIQAMPCSLGTNPDAFIDKFGNKYLYGINYNWKNIEKYFLNPDIPKTELVFATLVRHISLHEMYHIILDKQGIAAIDSTITDETEFMVDSYVDAKEKFYNKLNCDISLKIRNLLRTHAIYAHDTKLKNK